MTVILNSNKYNLFIGDNYINGTNLNNGSIYSEFDEWIKKWRQTDNIVKDGVTLYISGGTSDIYSDIWKYGYNNFEGANPTNYIANSPAKMLSGYIIFPELIDCTDFTLKWYNQYPFGTVSELNWSTTDDKDISNSKDMFGSDLKSGTYTRTFYINQTLKRLDFYFYMTGRGKINLYGLKVDVK